MYYSTTRSKKILFVIPFLYIVRLYAPKYLVNIKHLFRQTQSERVTWTEPVIYKFSRSSREAENQVYFMYPTFKLDDKWIPTNVYSLANTSNIFENLGRWVGFKNAVGPTYIIFLQFGATSSHPSGHFTVYFFF